jgi:hypothetical protein
LAGSLLRGIRSLKIWWQRGEGWPGVRRGEPLMRSAHQGCSAHQATRPSLTLVTIGMTDTPPDEGVSGRTPPIFAFLAGNSGRFRQTEKLQPASGQELIKVH